MHQLGLYPHQESSGREPSTTSTPGNPNASESAVSGAKYDLKTAMAWKQETIETLRAGIAFLMKKNKVEVVKGTAVLNPDQQCQGE